MYLKLLILNTQKGFCNHYEKFRMFEVEYSCKQAYSEIRDTFLWMRREKGVEVLVDGNDVLSMIDRDFKVLHEQYKIRSTEMFEIARHEGL